MIALSKFDKIIAKAYNDLRRDIEASKIIIRSAGDSIIKDTKRKVEKLLLSLDKFSEKLRKLKEAYTSDKHSKAVSSSYIGSARRIEKPKIPSPKAPKSVKLRQADRNFRIMETYRQYAKELMDIEERLSKIPKRSVRSVIPSIKAARIKFNKIFQQARDALEAIAKTVVPKNLINAGNYVRKEILKRAIQKKIKVKVERAIVRLPDKKDVICACYVIVEGAKDINKEDVDVYISLWCVVDLNDMVFSEMRARIDSEYVIPTMLKSELRLKAKDRAKLMKFIERDLSRMGIPLLKPMSIEVDKEAYRKEGFIPENITVKDNTITVIESADKCIFNPDDPVGKWKLRKSYLIDLYVATMKAAGIPFTKNPVKSVGRILFRRPKLNKAKREVTFKMEILPVGLTKDEVREAYFRRLKISKNEADFSEKVGNEVAPVIKVRLKKK